MVEFYAFVLSLALIFAAVMIHYQALRLLSVGQASTRLSRGLKILLVIFGLIVAHVLEAGLFAGGYWVGERVLDLGAFVGVPAMTASQLFFFSIETFTTQGVGDVYPVGALRLIASLEPLAGLILIGWSGSFTFLAMGLDWRLERKTTEPSGG
ncbi:potassium transporter Kef [Caulobacter segnis]|uniref:Kef-type K+ transport system NAD-binding component-related membrane protein n=3 Tax=Caulobacter segnis TaxID=88688 RepID=D5VL63_CAUST|nr:Kef-type K+ transport system NAD-binding component-related membrane protein [Caulobacter segnis ATCC 21756]AVQ04468.1 potassium transporter Kef [Caulobacter segnis]